MCVCVWSTPYFFSMWDLLGLQLIGDKVQGGGKGGGIKDGVSLEWGGGEERVFIHLLTDGQTDMQTGMSTVLMLSPLLVRVQPW